MRIVILIVCISFEISYSYLCAQGAINSFEPGNLWLDNNGKFINAHGGGFLFHKGTFYWFGEHKVEGKIGNTAQVGVHVYTSKDLYNWEDKGIALNVQKEGLLEKGCVIERPKVIYNDKTKKFVMWFHHELKGLGYHAALVGVAVADEAIGPYKYIRSMRLQPLVWPNNFTSEQIEISKKIIENKSVPTTEYVGQGYYLFRDFAGGQMSRDMTLYKDDDGKAYHITASEENQTLHISLLSDDYLSVTDNYVRALPAGRNEAPAIYKKNGKYYMISSGLTGWKPNPARSAVADSMLGEWTSLGNPCRGTDEEISTTFWSQSTYILPVEGKKDAFILMGDRWRPQNAIDGRYIWLPVEFDDGKPIIKWYKEWDLTVFNK